MTFKSEDMQGTQLTPDTDTDDSTVCDGCGKEVTPGVTMVGGIDSSCCGGGCARSICMDCVSAIFVATRPQTSLVMMGVNAERLRQDAQWGGPAHDDTHSDEDWLNFITKQAGKVSNSTKSNYRERLVKIASLAIAGLESMDRKENQQ